jgi:hypothetical protein
MSPSRPRTARRRSLGLAVSVLPLGHTGLTRLFNHIGGPGICGGPHTSKTIQYRLIGATGRMVVTPMQLWTAPWVRLQSAY